MCLLHSPLQRSYLKIIILNFLPEEFAEKSIYVHIILEFVYFP